MWLEIQRTRYKPVAQWGDAVGTASTFPPLAAFPLQLQVKRIGRPGDKILRFRSSAALLLVSVLIQSWKDQPYG